MKIYLENKSNEDYQNISTIYIYSNDEILQYFFTPMFGIIKFKSINFIDLSIVFKNCSFRYHY
jgi:hypothetical protein